MNKAKMIMLLFAVPLLSAAFTEENGSSRENTESGVYTIAKVSGGVDWDSVPVLPIGNVLWTGDAGIRAWGQLCHDDENLYVRLSASEKDIRAEYSEPLSPVHEDSCLEFFFMLGGTDSYFNFEINPNGCLRIQFGPGRGNRVDIVRDKAAEYFDIRTARTPEGWEVSYRIPLEFIRLFYPEYRFEGDLTANLYKCGDKTVRAHYLSWAKVGTASPDFHRPEYFGRMRFE